ncbi:formylmethanofuran dehydrogenase subunit C [Pseudaquabacterium rugosum]|uniref:Formylmethanofuran dehydrogenase subunit C n=1 Tax=Pseudaquabacterium rugosum TaxID=2984194 RepID=A0ABU9B5Q1_9BURK
MSGFELTVRPDALAACALRPDLRGLRPTALAGLDAAAVAAWPIGLGRGRIALGELFEVRRSDTPAAAGADSGTGTGTAGDAPWLRLQGDPAALGRLDRVGWGLDAGTIEVDGPVGDQAGALMSGGRMVVRGRAGLQAGCQLAGGALEVIGDVGDFAASGLPGSLDGMRGGTFIVHGAAGARLADRMRRGTLIVLGDAGDWAASRLVAGTVVLCGGVGAHLAYGQRRGSLLLLGEAAADPAWSPSSTHVPAGADAPVAWQLLARDLQARHGALHPRLQGLAARRPRRWLGDLAADGRGEVITAPA